MLIRPRHSAMLGAREAMRYSSMMEDSDMQLLRILE